MVAETGLRLEARTADFDMGDVGSIAQTLGHCIENSGGSDLVFLEMVKSSRYEEIRPNDWLSHILPELAMQHLGISPETRQAIAVANNVLVPP